MITVRGHEINVDIERELSKYEWVQKSIRGGKLLARSPFRDDRNPSFAVRLDNGVWIDSGSSDDWRKGSFVRLLSFLRHEQQEETEDYLLSAYGVSLSDVDALELDFDLTMEPAERRVTLSPSLLDSLKWRHSYLGKRGISEDVQRLFQIGYNRDRKAISFPWFDKSGQLINVKFRSVKDKRFWYMSGGDRIRNHIYGLHIIMARKFLHLFVVESETDALYLWTHGFPAVALGGANLTGKQRELLLRSGIRELVIATDNDDAGRKIADELYQNFAGYMQIKKIQLPSTVKDVNELDSASLLEVMSQTVILC